LLLNFDGVHADVRGGKYHPRLNLTHPETDSADSPYQMNSKNLWRETSFVVAMIAVVSLGLWVLSNEQIQNRLGQTYSAVVFGIAALAAMSLAYHIRERLLGRPRS
jgi:hypothetical protein